ncbi:MAG: Lcl C-terminal domain-containing protein [Planctomycetota bacterium]|jgi:hypothetical protein
MLIVPAKILSRGLPKTGQVTSYATGDDGTYEAGWWPKRLNANNRTRFIQKTINLDVIVIDLATGLMWPRDAGEAGGNYGNKETWTQALEYIGALTFAGFSDWRLPNILELQSICDWSLWNPAVQSVFQNVAYDTNYWSSTTRAFSTTNAKTLSFSEGTSYASAKSTSLYLLGVRGGV